MVKWIFFEVVYIVWAIYWQSPKVTEYYLGIIDLIFYYEVFLPCKSIILKKDKKFIYLSLILIKILLDSTI